MSKTQLKLPPQEAVVAEILTFDALERVLFLDKTLPKVEGHSSILKIELTNFVGDEVVRLIDQAKELQQKYVDLIHQRDELSGLENRDAFLNVQTNISGVTRQLRDASKALGRNLESKTNIPDNVAKFFAERAHVIRILTDLYDELKDELCFTRFSAAVEDDKLELELLNEAQKRQKEVCEIVAGLEAEIALEEEERQRDETAFKTEQGELERELDRIRMVASIDLAYEEKKAKETRAEASLACKIGTSALVAQVEKIREEADKAKLTDKMTMTFFADLLNELRDLKSHWNQKTESSLKSVEDAETELARERKPVIEELSMQRERKAAEDLVLKAELELLKSQEEIEKRRLEHVADEVEAVTLIQKVGRRYISQLKEKPVKKKGGKKKKASK